MGDGDRRLVSDNMSEINFILERLELQNTAPALFWRGNPYSGGCMALRIRKDAEMLGMAGVGPGSVVLLCADYSPFSVSLLLACIDRGAILAPLLPATLMKTPHLVDAVNPSFRIDVVDGKPPLITRREAATPHELIGRLQRSGTPGLILFTSGSTGQPKAVVHDFSRLLAKFHKPRPALRTLNFLLFDHWGGLNTLLNCLSNGSSAVLPENRTPDHICELIEMHQVELLPASPTFLNLLLLSSASEGRNMRSLRLITYGSETMPGATLAGLREAFPQVELRQTYGLIELGVLRAKSESSDSLWVKVGGEGYDLRVVDGILQIKAESAMLGYLNAPSPFTGDGYFITGDMVEVNGGYMRFLGRDSDLINVGGQKVFPAEVEAVLLQSRIVEEAVVYGQQHPITGKIVCADVQLAGTVEEGAARREIKLFCEPRLDRFKIPVKIRFVQGGLYNDRMKRDRIGREAVC